jgi:putative glutamine amidotransferase
MSNSTPVIGITMYGKNATGDYCLQSAYIKSVRDAGGVPMLLPPGEPYPEQLITKIDGLVLAGGGDIEPQIYNGIDHAAVYAVDPERDRFELTLTKLALKHHLPTLGICRGLQVLNVVEGGNLVPHIPDTFGLDTAHRHETAIKSSSHTVKVVPNSKVAIALGVTQTKVTSWHHQAILTVATNWQVVAQAPDGVIEAIEHKTHPWAIAVQWHPEMAEDCLAQQGLFRALIVASTN